MILTVLYLTVLALVYPNPTSDSFSEALSLFAMGAVNLQGVDESFDAELVSVGYILHLVSCAKGSQATVLVSAPLGALLDCALNDRASLAYLIAVSSQHREKRVGASHAMYVLP
jgi:hypothetical protein